MDWFLLVYFLYQFQEIEELGTAAGVKENISLAIWYSKFQKYWNSSPYYLEDEHEASESKHSNSRNL